MICGYSRGTSGFSYGKYSIVSISMYTATNLCKPISSLILPDVKPVTAVLALFVYFLMMTSQSIAGDITNAEHDAIV